MIKPQHWFDALTACQHQGKSYVLATLLATAGSTPRDGGTKMLVCDDDTYDTIGGGNLEHVVTQRARELLIEATQKTSKPNNLQKVEHFTLSSKLAQCCGGATNVLFEVFVNHCQHLVVYGAGHVAQALIPIICQLPLQVQWVDERATLFNEFKQKHPQLPANLSLHHSDDVLATVMQVKAQSWLLIMTHNHQLDYDLVKAALARSDCDYIGMIGSDTKARRFTTRLAHQGLSQESISHLVSPVGELAIPGKEPINVAVSIAAQLMQKLHHAKPTQSEQKQQWQSNQQFIASLGENA